MRNLALIAMAVAEGALTLYIGDTFFYIRDGMDDVIDEHHPLSEFFNREKQSVPYALPQYPESELFTREQVGTVAMPVLALFGGVTGVGTYSTLKELAHRR